MTHLGEKLRNKMAVSSSMILNAMSPTTTGVSTASGTVDLVFVTTRAGHLFALNARTGATVWSVQHGASTCQINNPTPVPNPSNPCHTNASPAIDPNRQYVYAYGLDGYVRITVGPEPLMERVAAAIDRVRTADLKRQSSTARA